MKEDRQFRNSPVICRLASRKSMLDFSDKLVLANQADARNLYGTGGRGHAPNATIGCNITNMESHDYCSFNIEPFVFDRMINICRQNDGERYVTGLIKDILLEQYVTSVQLRNALTEIGRHLTTVNEAPNGTVEAFNRISTTLTKLEDVNVNMLKLPVETFVDWNYSAQKVDVHHIQQNGFTECSVLNITRKHFAVNAEGADEPRRQPYYWKFEITNFEAKTKTDTRGLTNYIGSTARNHKKVSVDVTDDAVYEAAWLVSHFTGVFEASHCVPNYWNATNGEMCDRNEYNAVNNPHRERETNPLVRQEREIRRMLESEHIITRFDDAVNY